MLSYVTASDIVKVYDTLPLAQEGYVNVKGTDDRYVYLMGKLGFTVVQKTNSSSQHHITLALKRPKKGTISSNSQCLVVGDDYND